MSSLPRYGFVTEMTNVMEHGTRRERQFDRVNLFSDLFDESKKNN